MGAQIIKLRIVRSIIPKEPKKIPITENIGKDLAKQPFVMYADSNCLIKILNK